MEKRVNDKGFVTGMGGFYEDKSTVSSSALIAWQVDVARLFLNLDYPPLIKKRSELGI